MILEVAPLQIRPGQAADFEVAFATAQAIIAASPGYLSHELQRCVEHADRYLLLVRWRDLESHQIGFRQSPPTRSGSGFFTISTTPSRRSSTTRRFRADASPSDWNHRTIPTT